MPELQARMLYSTQHWSCDRHSLPSIHYLHTGADIIWYVVVSCIVTVVVVVVVVVDTNLSFTVVILELTSRGCNSGIDFTVSGSGIKKFVISGSCFGVRLTHLSSFSITILLVALGDLLCDYDALRSSVPVAVESDCYYSLCNLQCIEVLLHV